MKIKNGVRYSSNNARAAAYFLATCASRPKTAAHAAAYDLITGIYSGIIDDPARFGLNPKPDVCFEPWEQQRERQDDVKTIRDAIKKLEVIICQLYELALNSKEDGDALVFAAPLSRTLKTALAAMGVTLDKTRVVLPSGCSGALRELAQTSRDSIIPITDSPVEDKGYLFFSRCVFDPTENWVATAFDSTLDADGRLIRLCDELEKRGYRRIVCRDGKRISLDYVKQYGKKQEPVKMSWADKTHFGIELTYEDLRLEPYYIWLRMPDFKTVLERCGELPEKIGEFITANTKTCDGCRYCVQTDKTHTRPLAAVTVRNKKKCPYFPSFSMNWRELPEQLANDILSTLDAVYDD